MSKASLNKTKESNKLINDKLIEDWLQKRGYNMNYILGKRVLVKSFTCVFIGKDYIEIWHDIKGSKAVFITNSYLTNLPITLNYMEKI
jgi:hypothetical protein